MAAYVSDYKAFSIIQEALSMATDISGQEDISQIQ